MQTFSVRGALLRCAAAVPALPVDPVVLTATTGPARRPPRGAQSPGARACAAARAPQPTHRPGSLPGTAAGRHQSRSRRGAEASARSSAPGRTRGAAAGIATSRACATTTPSSARNAVTTVARTLHRARPPSPLTCHLAGCREYLRRDCAPKRETGTPHGEARCVAHAGLQTLRTACRLDDKNSLITTQSPRARRAARHANRVTWRR